MRNMQTGKSRRMVLFMAVTGISVFLYASCSTTPSEYRGSLSDAMDKAKDDHEGDRSVPDGTREPDNPWQEEPRKKVPGRQPAGGNGSYEEPSDTDTGYAPSTAGPTDFWVGFRGGNGLSPNNEMEPLSDGEIFAGGEASPAFEFDVFAGYKAVRAVSGSSLDESIEDSLLFLKAGFEGRFSPLPDLRFMSPYLSAGIGGFYMGWNFRNALTAGDETISSDSVTGLLMNVGVGVYPVKLDRFRLGVSLVPETCLFGPVTGEGFDNDYFDAFNSVKVMVEIAVKF